MRAFLYDIVNNTRSGLDVDKVGGREGGREGGRGGGTKTLDIRTSLLMSSSFAPPPPPSLPPFLPSSLPPSPAGLLPSGRKDVRGGRDPGVGADDG